MASASFMEMSLDDIIQKKKRENKRSNNAPTARKTDNPFAKKVPLPDARNKKLPIIDARNKIISKKRTQITDARDKLAELAKQKDARQKLEQLRKKRQALALQAGRALLTSQQGRVLASQGRAFAAQHGRALAPQQGRALAAQQRRNLQTHGALMRSTQNKERAFIDPSRQVVSQPLSRKSLTTKHQVNTKKFLENRSIERKSGNRPYEAPRLKPILRTVENDLDIIEDDDDPMGDDYIAPMTSLNRKANLQLRIIAHNNDVRESKSSGMRSHRLLTPEKEKSPPRPPSILKKRPMAALRNEKKTEEKPALEYRIIVSNLRNTVTGGDIEELFGDVGGMLESRLVRPGTAEVIYKTVEDAQKAVELYHNRQLDGQPMNCLLVTPRSATPAASRGASKPALYSTNSNVEPDISTFHKVLFSNF